MQHVGDVWQAAAGKQSRASQGIQVSLPADLEGRARTAETPSAKHTNARREAC